MKSTKQIEGWPTQPLSLDSQWAVWRDFIYHKYTVNNSTTWKKDMIPINIRRNTEESIEDQMQGLYISLEPYQAMEYYILHLPYKYQQFLQYWNDDHDNMLNYWKDLPNSSIHIASDGSYRPDTFYGAGAAVMANEASADEENNLILVGAKCNAVEGMTSLTAEQAGLISGLLLLHILCLRYGRPSQECIVHVWIDNAEVLSRITTSEADDIRLKSFGVRDFADMKILRNLHLILPHEINVKYHKIKSHQDQNGTQLSFEAQLNVQADKTANYINSTISGPICPYIPTPHDGLILWSTHGMPVSNIDKLIRCQVKGDEIKTYLKNKHQWTNATFATIDWIGLE